MEIPIAANWIASALEGTDAEVTKPGVLTGELSFQGKTALVRGELAATFCVPCARCLADAPVDAGGELCVHFERGASPRPKRAELDEDEAEEIDPGSPEEFTFDGITLDLRPVLIEHLVMSYPIRTLCAQGEACRGLCLSCGANLNSQAANGQGCTACKAREEQQAAASEAPAGNPDWQAALLKLRGKS